MRSRSGPGPVTAGLLSPTEIRSPADQLWKYLRSMDECTRKVCRRFDCKLALNLLRDPHAFLRDSSALTSVSGHRQACRGRLQRQEPACCSACTASSATDRMVPAPRHAQASTVPDRTASSAPGEPRAQAARARALDRTRQRSSPIRVADIPKEPAGSVTALPACSSAMPPRPTLSQPCSTASPTSGPPWPSTSCAGRYSEHRASDTLSVLNRIESCSRRKNLVRIENSGPR